MPRSARPWFRFYVEALADRKLRRFTPSQRWLWVAILGAARQSPEPGVLLLGESPIDAEDLADIAGMNAREVRAVMPKFEDAHLVERRPDGAWWVPKFAGRQFESDDVTTRTAKHRSNKQRRNVPTTPVGTPPETEADTETENSKSARTEPGVEVEEATLPSVVTESPHRADAERLCAHMASLLEQRGERVNGKAQSKSWLVPMEALLRIDGRDPAHVERVLSWLDAGEGDVASFWRPNIRSPEKLRAKWVQMGEQVARSRRPQGRDVLAGIREFVQEASR